MIDPSSEPNPTPGPEPAARSSTPGAGSDPPAPKSPGAKGAEPRATPRTRARGSRPSSRLGGLRPAELFTNRELSLLEFNRRVLEQAKEPATPLLERVRFLSICSTNLDEFFEIRVSGLKQQLQLGLGRPLGPDEASPRDLLGRISEAAHRLVEEQYAVLNGEILPALAKESILVVPRHSWSESLAKWVRRFFLGEVAPVLTPVAIDPAHPFPRVLNKSLNFLVPLEGRDAFGREGGVVVVNVPRSLNRLIPVPSELGEGEHTFVLLSSVIHSQIEALFPGLEPKGCYQFRVTRNSDLWVDEEETDDLLRALEGELPRRNYGDAVRLEVAGNCPSDMAEFLLERLNLEPEDLYQVDGPVNLNRLQALLSHVDRSDLKFQSFAPGTPQALQRSTDIFETLRAGDVLLHHPYEPFAPVVEFLRQASVDPDVLAIKQTLYRTGEDSAVVDALAQAAVNGKDVTAVVELRARFDEEANIDHSQRLQEAGVHVVYGIVGHKTHAKLLLVVRREGKRLRRYVHLGTGNYHTGTARAYTDLGLLSSNAVLGEDTHQLFAQLTGMGKVRRMRKLLHAPFTLHKSLIARVEREALEARAGRPAKIMAKMNSLTEPRIIRALYEASQAGVTIDLLVRGACCLRPGVSGLSERIRVRSIIGRFLEHHRVYFFHAAGEEEVWGSSADFMSRNFFRRVEAAFPVLDPKLKRRVISECFEVPLRDNTQSWKLLPDGSYVRPTSKRAPRVSQLELLRKLSGTKGE